MANLTTTDAVIIELFDNPLTENPDDRNGRVVNHVLQGRIRMTTGEAGSSEM
jgi:hypothetical protein